MDSAHSGREMLIGKKFATNLNKLTIKVGQLERGVMVE
jgi:hypothetical protein